MKIGIIRHADCEIKGIDYRISNDGRAQMQFLAEKLKKVIPIDSKVLVLCSSALRAIDSAEELTRHLPAEITCHDSLWSDSHHSVKKDEVFALITAHIEKQLVDVIFIITHLEYCGILPRRLFIELLKPIPSVPELQAMNAEIDIYNKLPQGRAYVIDIDERSFKKI